MLQARRLDLGADIVAIPSRELVAIHPDLSYAEALGALMGTLPDLHPDVARTLVEQVTPRPRPLPARRLAASVAVAVTAVLVAVLSPQSATAVADFGPAWRAQMAAWGLSCEEGQPGDGAWTCTDGETVCQVEGFARRGADLYLLDHGSRETRVMIFETERQARRYAERNPEVTLTGRVATWSTSGLPAART